jgi:beta-glucosidase
MSDYGRCDVAFLGDSITQGWETDGEKVWDREIAPFKAANFGFSGDRTEHVLWRLDNGELLPMRPKLVVLMIGTNNIYKGDSPEETVEGVRAILKTLTIDLPKTRILLLGIFPRAMNADDPLRQKVALANGLLKDCADGQHVRFLDIGAAFVREDGTLRTTMFPDLLHPNEAGYEIWAQAVTPAITEMLDDPTESPPPSIN